LEARGHVFKGYSDSEVIIHLFEERKDDSKETLIELVDLLDGDFAFVCYDERTKSIFAARDTVGVKPMFYGYDKEGSLYFSSEMKPIVAAGAEVFHFPPGKYFYQKGEEKGTFTQWYSPKWYDPKSFRKEKTDLKEIAECFEKAVVKRLMSDVPLGVFLSGGLDSSLVAGLVKKHVKELHSFSVGVSKDSSDLAAARLCAEYLGTIHHEVVFSFEEGLNLIEEVIKHIESFDVTSIRSSTPMMILSRHAKKYISVVLSGEGSDEMLAGYIYFRDAESPEMLQTELISKVQNLYTADVNRCDKATMGGSLEARVPFLDKEFLDLIMTINPEEKMFIKDEKIEKHILRSAFDDSGLLPKEILWRAKEQFSDGVGYSWIDGLIDYTSKQVSDEEMKLASTTFPYLTPKTKEAYYYRKIFSKLFPSKSAEECTKAWCPWSKFNVDPSGRFQRDYTK
jgi:asparagine synthase (glutamine-hydrolysing)